MKTVLVTKNNPGCLVQILWFALVGWWLGEIWMAVAWFLMVTVVGAPLAVTMLNVLPHVIALRGDRTAVEVLETRTGDCTEHSVLLVALARALGYPARVVVGMVSDGSVFAFHMWAEVGIDGWVPFDPALGEEEIDVTHIKLADSPVDAGWMRDVINPIFYLFSQMRIDVVNQTF